ncbi:MAG: ATP-grasp domain-containing protein [Candidatus Heimdallarchaeota archaeon]|nr:ATP-grasp domain-containing protein [Candidatus Heimdallarchaeota archaeon]
MTVLITDGRYKNSLAILRTLGEKKIDVFCSSIKKQALCFYSKYCKKSFLYPHPRKSPEKFIFQMKKIIQQNNIDVLMPVGVSSFTIVSKYKEELEKYAKVPVADYESYKIAHDKATANELAKKINVPAPLSYSPKSLAELKTCLKEFEYPVIIKARKGSSSNQVRYANDQSEAINIWQSFQKKAPRKNQDVIDYQFPIIQEYLPGEIVDVLFIFNQGKLRGCLTQERLLTLPVKGGSGALNVTTNDPKAAKYGIELMKALNWHGVGMVEFKRDANGTPKLLEINPKFWGTTEVSISAGMDFPYMLYKIAMEGDVKPNFSYLYPKKFGWPISMGVRHLLETETPFTTIKEYLKLFTIHNGTNIQLFKDPNPFSLQLKNTIRYLLLTLLQSVRERI